VRQAHRRGIATLVAGWLVLEAAMAVAGPTADQVFPESTQAFISISSVPQLKDQWNATQLGQLMNDSVMKPFAEDLRRQFEDRLSHLRDRLGLTLDDLRGVPSGELAVALIQPAAGRSALALVLDVTGNTDRAKVMLEKVGANLLQRGGKQSRVEAAGTTALLFVVPRQPNEPEGPPRQIAYFLRENLLGAADDPEVLKGMLARLAGQKSPDLASVKAYQNVMQRCAQDAKELKPLVRWYVYPLGYVETLRAATPEAERRKGKSIPDIMRNQGFVAIQGVGGFVNLKVESYELVHRTAIYAPPPYEKSMRMLRFPTGKSFVPQRWVPRDIAGYFTLNIDVLNAFDNFGPLFDELFGEKGETGLWQEVVESLLKDPNGPQLDLRKELIQHLGQRVTMISDYQLPITVDSERLLYAVETTDEKAVATAINKWMRGDPSAKKREYKDRIIWEMVEPEEHAVPELNLEAIPAIGATEPGAKKKVVGEPAGGAQDRLMPHAAVTVAHGELFIASHIDFLLQILELVEERKMLARDVDVQTVAKHVEQMRKPEQFAQGFSRTDEEYRPTYELIRQGKMPQSETMFGRLLNGLLGPEKKGSVRKQQVDGSKLPDYEVVRRYLGNAGLSANSEQGGWFIKGFTLSKGAVEAPAAAKTVPEAKKPEAKGAETKKPAAKAEPKKAEAAAPALPKLEAPKPAAEAKK